MINAIIVLSNKAMINAIILHGIKSAQRIPKLFAGLNLFRTVQINTHFQLKHCKKEIYSRFSLCTFSLLRLEFSPNNQKHEIKEWILNAS